MAKERATDAIPLSSLDLPQVLRLFTEVERTRQPRTIVQDGEELVIITPARKHRAIRPLRARLLTADDSLWKIVGISDQQEGPTDVSSNKYRYLAEAYQPGDE